MLLLLSIEFRSATTANAAASPASLPFWPLQASGAFRVSAPNFLRLLEKKSSFTLWHLCSPGQPWAGGQGGHTARLHPRKASLLCHGEINQIFLPQEGSGLWFPSSKYWGWSSAPLLKCGITYVCIEPIAVDKWWHFSRESGNHTCPS